jgi:hypothetical protein
MICPQCGEVAAPGPLDSRHVAYVPDRRPLPGLIAWLGAALGRRPPADRVGRAGSR